jgi:RNA polymerase sigma-70 factor (ECF subfamily)
MNTLSDESLVRQLCQRSDRAALATLVGRYERPIYSFLVRMLRDPHLAEEAAQETFLRMLRGLPTYRAELPFQRWLYRIALNCARTMAVRQREQGIRERVASRSRQEGDVGINPAEGAAQNELRTLVEDLPPGQKEALALHYFQGLSHSEVAAVLDVPAGTVATRIHGGLESLRGQLGAVGIVLTVGGVVELLGGGVAEAAPASILKSVFAQVPAGAAGTTAAAAAGGGLLVTQVKLSTLVAVALLCLVGGTVVGYKARALHDVPEEPDRLATASRELRPVPAQVQRSSPAGGDSLHNAPTLSSADSNGGKPVPVPPAPAEAKPSKLRRFGTLMGRILKAQKNQKTVNLSTKEAQEFMTLMGDPELFPVLEKGAQGFLGIDSAEFMIAFFEELGARLTAEQKAWLETVYGPKAKTAAADPDPSSSSSIDKALSELRGTRELVDQLKSALTPEQSKLIFPFLGQGFSSGSVVTVSPAAPEGTAAAILDAWSKNLVPLSDQDRLLLSASASAYAERLSGIQGNLVAQYGPGIITRLTSPPEVTLTTGGKAPPPPSGTPEADPSTYDPDRLKEVFGACEQLLGLESQERQALAALLPDRADDIRKAAPFVMVFTAKK